MKPAYAPDNTRSSIAVVLLLAFAIALVAVLIGLSDKPDVDVIGVAAGDVSVVVSPASSEDSDNVGDAEPETFGFEVDEPAADALTETDELGNPILEDSTGDTTEQTDQSTTTEPDQEVIVVPTAEASPTAEVAPAVEPTTAAATTQTDTTEANDAVQPAPSLPTSTGSVQGSFFTKGDENEGAVVAQNLITVSFAEDGSGAFQGVLDITYADGVHILLNMSGPLTWAPSNPQVDTTLAGAFTLDSPIDADDVMTDDAELNISSLAAGSGSLCTTKCFGFTFPPQSDL